MLCPIDGSTLLLSERQGIEIDYCPQCRGVWLDRGELDKIIERAAVTTTAPASPPRRDYEDRGRDYERGDDRYRKKKKRSLLEDLFDFD